MLFLAAGQPGLGRASGARSTPARPRALAKHVLGSLANLPIGVADGPAESGLHLVAFKSIVETGQSDHRPAPDRSLVLQGREHRHQTLGLTQGAQRRYGRLPAQRVAVTPRHLTDGCDYGRWPAAPVTDLAQGIAGRLDHGRRCVLQDEHQLVHQGAGPGGQDGRPQATAKLARPSSDLIFRVGQRGGYVPGGKATHSGQSAESATTDRRARIVETGAGHRLVLRVPGHDNRPPTGSGSGCSGRLSAGGHRPYERAGRPWP